MVAQSFTAKPFYKSFFLQVLFYNETVPRHTIRTSSQLLLTDDMESLCHCDLAKARDVLGRGVLDPLADHLTRVLPIQAVPDRLEYHAHPSVQGYEMGLP